MTVTWQWGFPLMYKTDHFFDGGIQEMIEEIFRVL